MAVRHKAFIHAGHKEQRRGVPRQFQPPFKVERFALPFRLDAAFVQAGEQDVGTVLTAPCVCSGFFQFAQAIIENGDGLLKGRVRPVG